MSMGTQGRRRRVRGRGEGAVTIAVAGLMLALAVGPARAQEVTYDVAFPNAAHHEAHVTVRFTGLTPGQPLDVRMSRSSPGRYALHEFAKNVYAVSAKDGAGRPITLLRPDPYGWTAAEHDGTVVFTYTLYGDRVDGTYAAIDETHAHLNIPATFVWARGLEERPVRIAFRPPAGADWRAATQLVPADGERLTFTAPDLQYFLDSPTELSDHEVRTWTVGAGADRQEIRLAVHHLGGAGDVDAYERLARAVVAEEIAIFGEAPEFDFGSYTFIADYLPWAAGDGMEHRNSTILSSSASLDDAAVGLLGTLAHEFFHAWSIERIRPAALEPFDFERANMTDALWFGEGFTSYYDDLALKRAGAIDVGGYARAVTGTLNTVKNSPGRLFFSPAEMSMQAPFVDAATSIDPTAHPNTFISYYTWGAALGLGLDLVLRTRFEGVTLDDFMRAMWQRYGEAQADRTPLRPYTLEDLQLVLGDVTGDRAFAQDFFDRHIRGREIVGYAPLLKRAGLLLRLANPGAAFLGFAPVTAREGRIVVAGATLIGTPLYEAGVDRGATLLALDDVALNDPAQLAQILAAHRPGDVVRLRFEQRGMTREVRVTLAEDPRIEVVDFEAAGRAITPQIRAFREEWLGSKAGRAR